MIVEAVQLLESVKNVEGYEEKAVVLEEALGKLNEIIDDYPSSDLAVKLISRQGIGALSLEGVSEVAERAREKAEKAAERARRKAERARKEARELEETLKAAEQGHVPAQVLLAIRAAEAKPPQPSWETLLKCVVAEESKEKLHPELKCDKIVDDD